MAEGKGPARRPGRQPRPVVCLETGEEYESAVAVAMEIGISQEAIRKAIRSGGLSGGYHWAYADDPALAMKQERYTGGDRARHRGGKVICLETGEEYESVTVAAAAVSVSMVTVCNAIRRGGRAGGYHWAFADDQDIAAKLERYTGGVVRDGRGRPSRPVICLETGEEYESVTVAAAAIGTVYSAVYTAIRTGGRRGGYHWAYADDPEFADKLERYFGGVVRDGRGRPKRPVICLETGEEYESVAAAAAAVSVSKENFYTAIRSGGLSGGYHWAYADDHELAIKQEQYAGGERAHQPGSKVICLETGEEYESVAAVAMDIGISQKAIRKAIQAGWRSGGYHWTFADDPDLAAKLEQYAGGEARVQAVTSVESAPYTVTGTVSDLTQNTVDGSLRGKRADENLMQDFSIKSARAARDKRQKVPTRVGLRDQGIKQ